MRYGYALVYIIRTLAFLVLITGMIVSSVALWGYMVSAEKLKTAAIELANQEEQSGYALNQQTFEAACAAIHAEQQARQEQRQSLLLPLQETLAELRDKGDIMHGEVARYDSSCASFEPVKQTLMADSIADVENVARGLGDFAALKTSYKNVMTTALSSNFDKMIALLRQKADELNKKIADNERKLAALKDKYKPVRKEVRQSVFEEKSDIDTLYGSMADTSVKAHIRDFRTGMPRLTELSAFTTEENVNYTVKIKEAGDKLVRWLPSTPPPSLVVKVSYTTEEPEWSAEDSLQRDLLLGGIQRAKDGLQEIEEQITELEARKAEALAHVASEWEIEGCEADALAKLSAIRAIQDIDVDAAINEAKLAKENADKMVAEKAVDARNAARRTYIVGALGFLVIPPFGPLVQTIGAWFSWLLLMMLADFTACPLVIALRTQSLDEK